MLHFIIFVADKCSGVPHPLFTPLEGAPHGVESESSLGDLDDLIGCLTDASSPNCVVACGLRKQA